MPFSDPMADGPAIRKAALRALKAGQTQAKTLEMVRTFREKDTTTPIVLMGYYNPIYRYGVERFLTDAASAGVDGLIVVDLPPEHDDELCQPAAQHGIDFIRLATPTTDTKRLPKVLGNASGFVYYVSVAGVTGGSAPTPEKLERSVSQLREHTELPIAVGFGIRTPEQAAIIGRFSDAVVVGPRWWTASNTPQRLMKLSTECMTLPVAWLKALGGAASWASRKSVKTS